MSIRVRFAPSPTGFLHVGGARTALFNWLLARQEGGTFVLRIEDTDRERSTEAHTRAILDGLSWLGLDWDEGPHFQGEGAEQHRADALRLLDAGLAYHDFATAEELAREREEVRATEGGQRRARERAEAVGEEEAERRAAAGEPFAVRFRVPDGETVWEDGVHGTMRFDNADIDDLVILRSDGTPTYNLAVVSDDAHMRISHVIRGDDHLSNTPKQILLYRALGHPVPSFAHVPMILGPDGRRLSKRHGATAVGDYADRGLLPEAMVNFLALLGWSPGDDEEVMDRDRLVERFSLERVVKKSAVFDPEKLAWLNGQHLARVDLARLEPLVAERLAALGVRGAETLPERPEWYRTLVDLLRVRSRTTVELAEQALPYVSDRVEYDHEAVSKHWLKDPEGVRDRLERVRERLEGVEEDRWDHDTLERELRGLAGDLEVGFGKVVHPLRVALLGVASSPGIFDVLVLVGRGRTLERIDRALTRFDRVLS